MTFMAASYILSKCRRLVATWSHYTKTLKKKCFKCLRCERKWWYSPTPKMIKFLYIFFKFPVGGNCRWQSLRLWEAVHLQRGQTEAAHPGQTVCARYSRHRQCPGNYDVLHFLEFLIYFFAFNVQLWNSRRGRTNEVYHLVTGSWLCK